LIFDRSHDPISIETNLLSTPFNVLVVHVSGKKDVEPIERGDGSGLEIAQIGSRSAATLSQSV
jgi:hypothetical protein